MIAAVALLIWGSITEDEIKGLEDDAQKLTDKFVAKVDAAVDAKCKEILTV